MEKVKVDRVIFGVSILIIIAVCIPLVMFPDGGTKVVGAIFEFITSSLGVFYLWAGLTCLIFLLWLSFGKYGGIVLGFEGEKPQFSLYR